MAHYYDSLRFYENMEEDINNYPINTNTIQETNHKSPTQNNQTSYYGVETPPFQFKSMSSLNYRQQFKGSDKITRELFQISLNSNFSPIFSDKKSKFIRDKQNNFFSRKDSVLKTQKEDEIKKDQKNNQIKQNSSHFDLLNNSLAKNQNSSILSFDKYLFNEYPNNENLFSHEEDEDDEKESDENSYSSSLKNQNWHEESTLLQDDFNLLPSKQKFDPLVDLYNTPLSISSKEGSSTNSDLDQNENIDLNSPENFSFQEALDDIYEIFGLDNPFYVGWDKDLRKFILTSRVLPQTNSLMTEKNKTQISQTKKKSKNFFSLKKFVSSKGKDNNDYDFTESNQKTHPKFFQFYSSWPLLKHQYYTPYHHFYSLLYADEDHVANNQLQFLNFSDNNMSNSEISPLVKLFNHYCFIPPLSEKKKIKFDPDENENPISTEKIPINFYKHSLLFTKNKSILTPTSTTFYWPGSTKLHLEVFFSELYDSLLNFFYSPYFK